MRVLMRYFSLLIKNKIVITKILIIKVIKSYVYITADENNCTTY